MKGHIIVAAILAGIAFAPPESSQAQPNRRSNQNFRRYPPPPPPPPPGYRPPIQVFTLPNIQPSPQKTLGIATYRAVENEKLITLTATGQNATSGYQNLLEARTTTGSALSYNFVQVLPVGPVTQIGPVKQKATPFSVSFTFKPRKPARVVWVYDARGRQRVRVEVAPKRPAALQASISPELPVTVETPMTAKQRVPADSTLDVGSSADAEASTQIAPGKLCGKLHTDTRTQRGESTGVMIDQMEVDFGRELNAALVTMNGTPLTVTGQMTIRNGITRSPRNVFVVDKVIFVGTLRTELSAVGGTTSSYAINGMCIDFDRSIDLGTVRGSKDRPVTVVGELTICRRLKRPRLVLQVQRLEEAR